MMASVPVRCVKFNTITNNPARPMDPALAPYTPIIENIKQKTAMSITVANAEPTTKPVSKEAMKMTRLHTSMAFFRCSTGPALSTIVTHTAPSDIVMPIFSWWKYVPIIVGSVRPKVMRRPSLR